MYIGSLISCGVLVAGLLAGAVAGASPAHAVGCHDNGCNGKLPEVQGCDDDARTIWSYTYTNISTDLRYSPACDAIWGRIRDNREEVNECDSTPSVRVQSRVYEVASGEWRITATEARHMTGETRCGGRWAWTRMIGRADSEERIQYGRWTGENNLWSGGSGWAWAG